MNLNSFDPKNKDHLSEISKIEKIIKNSIKKTELDLSGLTILTEAATGYWAFTPIIASMANAQEVICKVKDTKFGKSQDIIKNYKKLLKYFKLESKVNIFDQLEPSIISKADIVTNSGNLRPITNNFISKMKETSVISLMWEPWEYRKSDFNLKYCIKNNVTVIGVNEDNSVLNVMKYDGQLIQKILQINNLDTKNMNILLIGENKSAFYMIKPLEKMCSTLYCLSSKLSKELKSFGAKNTFDSFSKIIKFLPTIDLIIINSHPISQPIIGKKGFITAKKLKKLNPHIRVLVFFGDVDFSDLDENEIVCFPNKKPQPEHMSWTSDILGPKPVLELNTIGIKAGEIVSRYRKQGKSMNDSIKLALKSPFCLDFSINQKF